MMLLAQAIHDQAAVPYPLFWTVVSAMGLSIMAMAKYFYDRSKKCEDWRDVQEPIIRQLMERAGLAEGVNDLVNECPVTGCPWKGRLEAFSVEKEHKTKRRNQQL